MNWLNKGLPVEGLSHDQVILRVLVGKCTEVNNGNQLPTVQKFDYNVLLEELSQWNLKLKVSATSFL